MNTETPQDQNEATGGQSRAEGANLTAVLADRPWKRKWYMNYEFCERCPLRFSEHDMNCIECCPVKRGDVSANNVITGAPRNQKEPR